jgi:hypothetical protein
LKSFRAGDRVRTRVGRDLLAVGAAGVVVHVRPWAPGEAARCVEVRFEGTEWFYPYHANFNPEELEPAVSR